MRYYSKGFRLVLGLILFSSVSWAQKTQTVTTFENIKNTPVEIQCLNADLKVIHDASKPHLKIGTQVFEGSRGVVDAEWTISVNKDPIKEIIQIRCHYPQRVFVDKKLETSKRFYIIIRGPSVELTVNSRAGKVLVQGWKRPTQIVVENGSVKMENTSSSFKVNLVKGTLDANKHHGRLTVDAFNGKLELSNIDGNLDMTNFTGTSVLKSIDGDISIDSKSGKTVVESSKGSLKFDADDGKLDLVSFHGSIVGISDQAQITAKLANPARFKATIKNANIKLSAPASSGAQVYFALNEGQFSAPSYLNKDENGSRKTLKGTLRGGESGRISVIGEAGKVNLKIF